MSRENFQAVEGLSVNEFAEVQEHLGDEKRVSFQQQNKGVYLLEEINEEDTLILDVSDNNEPFEIKEVYVD